MNDEAGAGTPTGNEFWRTRLNDLSIFFRLGCTSFGGPIAHLGYFRTELVERRGWCSEATYAEIIAVASRCRAPPVVRCFSPLACCAAVGWEVSLHGWVLPFHLQLLMTCFAFAEQSLRGKTGVAVVHGLQLSAVAVVAQAILVMRKSLTPDWRRVFVALVAGVIALFGPPSFSTLLAIAVGAIGGAVLLRGNSPAWLAPLDLRISRRAGIMAALVYLVLLGASAIIPAVIPQPSRRRVQDFLRSAVRSTKVEPWCLAGAMWSCPCSNMRSYRPVG